MYISVPIHPLLHHKSSVMGVSLSQDMAVGDTLQANVENTVNLVQNMPPLFTGFLFYAIGFILLTYWEENVVPFLKLKSILPDIPLVEGQLTAKQTKTAWIIPLTADNRIPLPTLDELDKKGKHRIGVSDGVVQFITAKSLTFRKAGVQEISEEWSEYYNAPIIVFKKHFWK